VSARIKSALRLKAVFLIGVSAPCSKPTKRELKKQLLTKLYKHEQRAMHVPSERFKPKGKRIGKRSLKRPSQKTREGGRDDTWLFDYRRHDRHLYRTCLGVQMIDFITRWLRRRRDVPREPRGSFSFCGVRFDRDGQTMEQINAQLMRETMDRIASSQYFELRE
jgi:hypothetical protein